jgi:predicted acylesterase/phospholipase RssA
MMTLIKPRPYKILYVGPESLSHLLVVDLQKSSYFENIVRKGVSSFLYIKKNWIPQNQRPIEITLCTNSQIANLHLQTHFFNHIFIDVRPSKIIFKEKKPLCDLSQTVSCEFHYETFLSNLSKDFLDFAPTIETQITVLTFKEQTTSCPSKIVSPVLDWKAIRQFIIQERHDQIHQKTQSTLCIGGGGLEGYINALALLNMIESHSQKSFFQGFTSFGGVSSGSILSAFLGQNLTTKDIEGHLLEQHSPIVPFKFSELFFPKKNFSFKQTIDFFTLTKKSLDEILPEGFISGDVFLEKLTQTFTSSSVLTNDFQKLKKKIYIGCSNLSSGQLEVLSPESSYSFSISEAIRASCSLPILFESYKKNEKSFIDGMLYTDSLLTYLSQQSKFIVLIQPLPQKQNFQKSKHMGETFFKSLMTILQSRQRLEVSLLAKEKNKHLLVFQNPIDEFQSTYAFPFTFSQQKKIYYHTMIESEKKYSHLINYYEEFLGEFLQQSGETT